MEMKELTDSVQGAVAALRETKTQMDTQIKEWGSASALYKEQMEKQNARIDEIELKTQRAALVPAGEKKEASAHTKAFLKWMRQGKHGLEPSEKKALVEDATGLYLVPEDIEAEIIRAVPQLNAFRQLASVSTTTRDKVRKRSITEVTMAWGKIEGSASISESTQTPTTDYIYVEDLYGLTKIGEDELADVGFDLAGVIANSFAVAKANTEDAAFAMGRGHTTYEEPDGLALNTTLQTSIGASAGAGAVGTYGVNWTTDDTVILEDVLKAEYMLPTQYLPNASWLVNRKTEAQMRLLRAGGYTAVDGPWLWQPAVNGMPKSFDSFPIFNSNTMKYPADTTAGINMIFGDFKLGYRIVDRLGMTVQRFDELYSESGLIGFKSHFRVGGSILRPTAFVVVCNDT